MPILNGQLDADGALVQVLIGVSQTEALQLRTALRPIPPPIWLSAIVDSGAECTCVDFKNLTSLSLPLVNFGFLNVPALSGLTPSARFDVSLTIVHPSGTTPHNLVIPDLIIEDQPLGRLGYQVLIGRDVLNQCIFLYDGPSGKFSLTY